MDSMSDILFLVVALAISVIPALVKRKKNQKTAEKPQEPQTPAADDPWAAIMSYLNPSEEKDSNMAAPEEDRAVTAWDDKYGRHEDSKEFSYLEREAKYIVGASAVATPPPVPGAHSSHIPHASKYEWDLSDDIVQEDVNKVVNDSFDDQVAGISNDFNLRNAILYSEILKPKFEE